MTDPPLVRLERAVPDWLSVLDGEESRGRVECAGPSAPLDLVCGRSLETGQRERGHVEQARLNRLVARLKSSYLHDLVMVTIPIRAHNRSVDLIGPDSYHLFNDRS